MCRWIVRVQFKLLILLFQTSFGHMNDKVCDRESMFIHGQCGSDLANVLHLICGSRGFYSHVGKRDSSKRGKDLTVNS